MSERVKFDDEASAKGKIATSPEITIQKPDTKSAKNRGKEPAAQPVQTGSQPVQGLADDPEADARYSRMMGRLARRAGKIDDDFAAEIAEWGKDFIFPTLRDLCRGNHGAFRGLSVLVMAGPAAFFAIKAAMVKPKTPKKDKEEEKANG